MPAERLTKLSGKFTREAHYQTHRCAVSMYNPNQVNEHKCKWQTQYRSLECILWSTIELKKMLVPTSVNCSKIQQAGQNTKIWQEGQNTKIWQEGWNTKNHRQVNDRNFSQSMLLATKGNGHQKTTLYLPTTLSWTEGLTEKLHKRAHKRRLDPKRD